MRLFLPALLVDRTWSRVEFVPVDFASTTSRSVPGPHRLHVLARSPPSSLPGGGPAVYFVHCPGLYDRPVDLHRPPDDAGRFAFLARAAIESCQRMGFAPDVFHVNDWHAALVPLYLRTHYGWDRAVSRGRTLLTIHNIGYPGQFSAPR